MNRRFSYGSSNLDELLSKFHLIIDKVKRNHRHEMESLEKKLVDYEEENRRLRQTNSMFDIDFCPSNISGPEQLKLELENANKQIDLLQKSLDEKYSEYEEMKSKYTLQILINQNPSTTNDSMKCKELQMKLDQIKDQLNQMQFDNDEQIRLLKQILFPTEPNFKAQNQNLTVKQSDLFQQTNILENLLQKQHEKILSKFNDLFDRNPRGTATKKSKRKRLV